MKHLNSNLTKHIRTCMLKLQNADEIKELKELSQGLEDSTSHRYHLPKLIYRFSTTPKS